MKRISQLVLTFCLILTAVAASAQAPVANFMAVPLSSCSPMVAQFTDLSTNTPTSWTWNLGNGTTSTLQNPSTTYTLAGTYTVTLTVSNASGTDTKTITNYITISPIPTVNFVVNDSTPTCRSKTVTFTNLSTPNSSGTASYYWDFGDGTTSSLQNPPAHTYSTPGSYNVSLVVTNGAGCYNSLQKNAYIQVLAKPTAGFVTNYPNLCTVPATDNFFDASVGASSYLWDFGDGGTSTSAAPTHIYTTAGTYTVRQIVTSAGGCKDTAYGASTINVGSPTASFTQSATAVCKGSSVIFTNSSTGGTSYSWSFGDGSTSTSVNPSHSYTSTGTYNVRLLVSNPGTGCIDSVVHTVTVSSGPTTAFTGAPLYSCSASLTTSFSNATVGATSYLWIFGDGSTSTTASPSHTYAGYGTYTVTLVSTNSTGCSDTLVMPSYVLLAPATASINGPTLLGCAPATKSFSATTAAPVTIATYSWNFGDGGTSTTGPTISHTYVSAGVYTVTLTMTTTTGCTITTTQSDTVGAHSTPAFSGTPTTMCYKTPVFFTNTSTGATNYTWLYGDGGSSTLANPSYVYGDTGTFNVTLISTNNGCNDTLKKTNYITVNGPIANFTYLYSCSARKFVTFTNTSKGGTSYTWNFGDGTPTSSLNSPTHTYSAFGTYAVTLIATSSVTGCTDTMIKNVVVFDLAPTFVATDTILCKGASTIFISSNTQYVIFQSWNFGDGTTSTGSPNTHTYTTAGIFSPKLIVMDVQGCVDSVTRTNYINVHAPSASFTNTPNNGCLQLTVTFTDNSTASTGNSISNRFWDFGDGTTLNTTSTTIVHTYTTAGTYTVKLAVTETGGCTDTSTHLNSLSVYHPTSQFTTPDVFSCLGYPTHFTSNPLGDAPFTYFWDFGDATTSTSANPNHTYAALGTYTVKLIATDAHGCSDTLTRTSYVNVSTVHSGFTMSDSVAACPPFAVSFTNTSTNAVSYLWIFGNGSTSSIANPSAAFTSSGTFTVKLVATNANGCKDTSYHNIVIGVGPSGTLTYMPLVGCSPLTVTFTSTSANTNSITYDFDNGVTNTTTSSSVTYTYNQPGIFIPKLILSNINGCSTYVLGSDSVKVTKAIAGFIAAPSPVCPNVPVSFTDTSSAIASTISTRAWNFGDGGTSSATNPTHSYTTGGTYNVRLVVTTASGCSDTAFRTVVINPTPVITGTNQTICGNGSVVLNANGASTYSWSPATGLSCTSCASPTANPTTTTTYTITGTSSLGCTGTGTITVNVNPVPVVSAGAAVSICNGTSTTLTATGAATYSWSPSTGLSCTNCASPSASPSATTTYTVTGTSAAGCSASDNVTVTVNTAPTLTVTPSQAVCAGTSSALTATGATTYNWSPSTGLSCTTCANPTATPSATTTYTVTGTALGCSSTATTTITVNPIPVVSAGPATAICIGSSTTLNATGATSYSWTPSTGLSCTNCASPVANPTTTTTYTVTGTTAGCSSTATKTITVNPLPTVVASADTAICAGTSKTLTVTGATTYSWTPATGLSCTTCASPVATPAATTTYIVSGTNTNGCINQDTVVVTVNPLPIVSGGSNQFMCPGGSVTLNGTGAATYSWSPATGLSCTACASPVASPSATTTYTVTGTSALGCTSTATAMVTVNTQPTVTVTGTMAVCAGGTTTLTANGATTYSWSPSTGLSCSNCASPTVTPTATTTYTVTGTSGVGCSGTTTATVTVNPLPTVSAGSNVAICAGASTTLAGTGATSYSWSPSAGLSCTNCASPIATPATTTTYTLTGTNANGCINTATVTVTVNPLPTVSAGSNTSICPGGSASLTATGAVSYSWTPSATLSCSACANPTATPAATTTYTVTGTSAAGCTSTSMVTVSVNAQPVVTVAGTLTICAGGSTTLTASGANTFSWSPATGLSCTTCANPTANPSATTTYTVTGTSGVGCTASTTVTVTVNPLPTVSAGASVSICSGSSSTLGATGATSYVWSPSAGLSCTACASPVASPTATTTYMVTGTNANGCVNTDTMIVTVNPLPTVSAGSNTSICPGGSATLAATGATGYVWTPGATLSCTTCASPVASPSATTTYTVTGTDANGCANTSTVTVSVNAQPVVTVAGTRTICAGGSTTLTASGANTFSWSPATGLSCTNCANPTANPSATTTYTVTGTSGVGCTASTTVTVTVNPLPTVSAGASVSICSGSSSTLGATGATSYVWSPSAGLSCTACASPVASPTATTTYMVTGTNANGCVNTDTMIVTVNPLPTVSAGSNTSICPGGSATLAATGATGYVWTPGATLSCTTCASPVASPSATTTYTVTGTDGNGCSATSTVTVSVNQQPIITVAGTTAICTGGSTALTASGANTFSWTPSTGLSCTACANPTANPATTTTYTVTGTSGVGCTGSTTVTVTVNPLPVVNAGADVAICTGASTTLTATGATTYSWTPGTGLSCTACVSPVASPTATTTYIVTGTNSNGCVKNDTVVVTVNPLPTVSAGAATSICPGGSTTLTATGAATYSWSPATGLSCTACASPVASPSATTTYSVTGTSSVGCTSTSTVTVSVNAQPVVAIAGNTTICAGASTSLTASGANSYSWSPATGLSCTSCANPTATPTATTTYIITGTSGVGCTGTTTVTVTVNPLPSVSAGSGTAICAGTSTTLTATGATSYVWSPSTGLSCSICATTTANPTATTTYTVTGTSAAGCTNTSNVTVTVNPLPSVSAGNNTAVCPGGSATLTATGASSYVWTPGATLSCTACASPVATPSSTTTYTVTGTGANGCANTSTVTVTVNQLPTVSITGNTSVCAGTTTTLVASGAASYSWSPSTGLSCVTCSSPTVTPSATTTYTVVGTSGVGCTGTASITVTVHQLPVITADPPQTACLNTPVQLTASGGASYVWSPTAGLSCTTCSNPIATPAATTTYTVIGTDAFGCSSQAQTTLTILPLPTVSAGNDVYNCRGNSANLLATGAVTYVWSPAAGLSCTTCDNPVATPTSTTAYVVAGTGTNGCTNTDTVTVGVYAQPPVNAGPDQTICSGQSAQLQASGALTYTWTPGTSLSCTSCGNPVSTPSATITYQVAGIDDHGCRDSDLVTVTVIQRQPVSVDSGSDFCIGGSLQLHAYGGDNYQWSPAGTLTCTNCPDPIATPTVTTTYTVYIRQGQCFTDTLQTTVTVHQLPTVDAGPDQSIIAGNTAQIHATGTDIASYNWTPIDWLSCSDCPDPVSTPLTDITYTVHVVSPFGCVAADSLHIHVRCDGTQLWMPNTFTPNADGENDFFYPHGKGITQVTRFRIYDRWGELLFERSNMPINDRNYGWNGTYKSQILKPDVYVYILDATCTNGEPLQIKGDISLVR